VSPISLLIDARTASQNPFTGELSRFLAVWGAFEAQLLGKSIHAGLKYQLATDFGPLAVEVLSPSAPDIIVDKSTEFRVVSVVEERAVLPSYQCAACRREGSCAYGPFICQKCQEKSLDCRVCDLHCTMLPGSLSSSCPDHIPHCEACGAVASRWCPGPRCKSSHSWCEAHSFAHPSDRTVRYCQGCYAELFPACGTLNCHMTGYNTCSRVDASGRMCGEKCCARHTWRWQVFGPQAIGLPLCHVHSGKAAASAQEAVARVLQSCAVLGWRAPSLPSLVHAAIKATGIPQDANSILGACLAIGMTTPPSIKQVVQTVVGKAEPQWRKQLGERQEAQSEKTRAVVLWLRSNGHDQAAQALSSRNWSPPRDDRPGTLYVFCDARLFPRLIRDQASATLGFDIRIAG